MFVVYPRYGNLDFPPIASFELETDAQELCLALAQAACEERAKLEHFKGIIWTTPNTLTSMGYHYVKEV